MSLEIIGLIYHQFSSQIRDMPKVDFDLGAIQQLALAHEASGYDRVLIAQNASMPDPLMIGAYTAAITTKLNFMLAHRPGFIAPTMAARIFATIDQLSGGRASVHVITGASDAEMLRDGDTLTKERRYQRSREYVNIMRALSASDAPIDHEGEFYRFRQAFCDVKPTRPTGMTVSWGGVSQAAFETGGECADVFAMIGDAPDAAQEFITNVQAEAARHGRKMRFAITLSVILGETEAEAWGKADDILAKIESRVAARRAANPEAAPAKLASVAFQRILDRAMQGDVVGKNIWMAVNRVTGGAGGNTTIVGTIDQVVETLMEYHALGITGFLLRGYNGLDDIVMFGKELIPFLRQTAAKHEAI